jgi:hypothetical protein
MADPLESFDPNLWRSRRDAARSRTREILVRLSGAEKRLLGKWQLGAGEVLSLPETPTQSVEALLQAESESLDRLARCEARIRELEAAVHIETNRLAEEERRRAEAEARQRARARRLRNRLIWAAVILIAVLSIVIYAASR